ncbi:HEPN domain-containing protein [Geoalkalibacter halelectricus]|uniref:HEPN domain-containing protein n=1 Tax=Geoalkalibacter halelectricus TaxID=2847045 RepID=UPI003D1BA053
MIEEVRRYLEKAEHALHVAEDLMRSGYAPDAASKVYYAMFYAAQALLKSAGIEVVKHSAVEAAFGYHFAKPGRVDPKFHKMLMNARKIREIADYDISEEIVEPVASLKLEEGRAFLVAIREVLGDI